MASKLIMVAALSAVALVGASSASAAKPAITNLTYTPKPLYNDEIGIIVSFDASRAARPGYEWGIFVHVSGRESFGSCTSMAFSWDRKFGGNPSKHMQRAGNHVRLVLGTRYGYWCRGPAHLEVVEHKTGQDAIGIPLGTGSSVRFRIAGAPWAPPAAVAATQETIGDVLRTALVLSALATLALALVPGSHAAEGAAIVDREGQGARVVSFNVRQAGPLGIIYAGGGEPGNVILTMTGPSGRQLLVNRISGEKAVSGVVVYPFAKPGRYRLSIDADLWSIGVSRYTAKIGRHSEQIPGRFAWNGDTAWEVFSRETLEPTVTAQCTCKGNFQVWLRDYRGRAELLVNEIGRYRGQVLGPRIPPGFYILEVRADGPYVVKFSR